MTLLPSRFIGLFSLHDGRNVGEQLFQWHPVVRDVALVDQLGQPSLRPDELPCDLGARDAGKIEN
jgi:hypothetical protein